ncbi:TetR/AcrR family transcriptional regulator [Croceicoccus ponticola]|uniref:TetR/AcrR family transcriptional regulator n=1 Tax=Croceicoccus ponticola TaxID=2217664 RepID=A0A437GXY0_9SPHN|nr:TetR/AcrR family transcriptional regulator [Croceicoccus ponticola]RVQ67532.1 TetR/AcrR family transcriptional regulator [Croceicoccus ponticola]
MNVIAAQPESDTRQALLLAAENLFGIYGFDGTSMRRIGADAGQANVSVVRYHFETKENLAFQILDWRVAQMEGERRQRLAMAMEREPGQRLHDLVAAIFLPVLGFTDAKGKHTFARFLIQYMTTFRAHGVRHPEELAGGAPALAGIVAEMNRELHFLSPPHVRMRSTKEMIGFMSLVILHDQGTGFFGSSPDLTELIADGINTSVAALQAPPPRLR